jgi:hypothetical protein
MAEVRRGVMVTPAGERPVAIKRLRVDREVTVAARQRMIAEARLVFQLTHANICQVIDLAENEDGIFIVMELVNGLDLRALLQRLKTERRSLEVAHAVYIAREVARALAYAHRRTDGQGRSLLLIHGDVTPANILLSAEGEVKLADFGISRALRTLAPGNEVQGGTPGFMAPEVEAATPATMDQRADLYGIGAVLYAALAGTPPRREENDPRALARRRPEVPNEILDVIARATALRPDERYLSAADLELALSVPLARRFPQFVPSVLGAMVTEQAARSGDTLPLLPSGAASPIPGDHETVLSSLTCVGGRTVVDSRDVAEAEAPPHATLPLAPPTARRSLGLFGAAAALVVLAAVIAGPLRRAPPSAPVAVPLSAPAVAVAPAAPKAVPPATLPPSVAPPVSPLPPVSAARSERERRARKAAPGGIGYLTVSSVPWGVPYIDGKPVAKQTPLYRLPVATGPHRVAVLLAAKQMSTAQQVTVRPGETHTLGFRP